MGAQNVGEVSLDIILNSNEFDTKLRKTINECNSNISNGINKSISKTGNLLSKVGKIAAGAFAVSKVVQFSKACIDLGSDLQEVQNVVDTTFGSMSGQIDDFASGAIEKFGLSELSAKQFSSTIGAMMKSTGITGQQLTDMSTTLTGLAGDMASFYNLSGEEAFAKIRSGISGESEPLKQLGIDLTETTVKMYAMNNGLQENWNNLSTSEKYLWRYKSLLSQTADAQGDFAKTLDNSWANQTRVLAENFNRIKASLGQALINVLLPIVKVLNQITSSVATAASAFGNFTAKIFGMADTTTTTTVSQIGDTITDTTDAANNAIDDTVDNATKAAKKISGTVFGFDELNKLNAPEDDAGGSGTGGAGGLGTGGGISSAATTETNGKLQEQETILDKIIARAKELAEIFKTGFKFGLDSTNFDSTIESIKGHIENIKKSLIDIFGDGQVLSSFNSFINSVVYGFGVIIGDIVGVGASIANALIGSISKYLEDNKAFIKSKLISIFEIGSEIATNFTNIFNNLSVIISDFFNNPTLQKIGADLLEIIINPILTGVETAGKFISDCLYGINKIIQDNKSKIQTALSGLLDFIEPITNPLSTLVNNIGSKFSEVYDSHIKPSIDNITSAWSSLAGTVLDNWNNYIQPVLDNLASKFSDVIENHISPLISNILELGGELIEFVSNFYNNNLEPIIEKLKNFLAPILATVAEAIGITLLNAISLVSDAFSVLIGFVESIVEFFNEHKLACDLLEGALLGVGVALGIVNAKLIATKIAALASQAATVLMTAATTAFSTVAGICSTAAYALGGAIAFLTSPIGLVILAITAIIAIGVALYKNWDVVKEKCSQLGEFLSEKFENIKNWCSEKWTTFTNGISNLTENLKSSVSEKFNNLKNGVTTTVDNIKSSVSEKWTSLKDGVTTTAETIKTNISTKFNNLKSGLSSVFDTIKENGKNKFSTLKDNVINLSSSLKDSVSTIWNNINNATGGKAEELKNKVINSFNLIKNGATNIFNGLKSVIQSVFSSLVNIIKMPINGIISIINKAINAINGLSIDIPSWVPGVGGSKFGFSLPNIPMLEEGGVISQPTLAMVGEGNETEIVTPESKMEDIVNQGSKEQIELMKQMLEEYKEMKKLMNALLNKNQDIYMDRDKVASLISNTNNSRNRQRG